MVSLFDRFVRACWFAFCLLGLAAVSAACTSSGAADDAVPLYAYHLKPPFIIDEDKRLGLYYDFASYINAKRGYSALHTEYRPRKRLDIEVAKSDFSGLVIGVNPLWFGDKDRTKYLWTPVLMHDRDEVVSRLDRPVDYQEPHSLRGMVVGLPRGYYYFGIDELVAQGLLVREDVDSELQCLQQLERGRIMAAVVSRSTLDYLRNIEQYQPNIYISQKPHDDFDRFVLVSHKQQAIYDWLVPLMKKLPSDPDWQKILARYR